MLKIRQLKVYADGIIVNATAALSAPYNDNLGFPFTTGLNYFTQSRLAGYITQLEPLGYDFHIHAIGDRGITESLNAIQSARTTNGNIGARHRVTHVEMLNPTDLPRFSNLNVVADMQVAGDFTQPSHWHENEPLIGATRSDNWVPLKSIFNAGAKVTLSSDWDVSTVNPFVGMQNALTRIPQELPSVEEVVKAYTINGAYVMRQENVTGSLSVGKYADLIVLDKDIFTIPTNQVNTTKVVLTLLAGVEVYSNNVLAINEVENSSTIQVFPTVTSRELFIRINSTVKENVSLKFYSISGKVVKSENIRLNDKQNEYKIDVSDLSEGVYVIKTTLDKNNKTHTNKIIISK